MRQHHFFYQIAASVVLAAIVCPCQAHEDGSATSTARTKPAGSRRSQGCPDLGAPPSWRHFRVASAPPLTGAVSTTVAQSGRGLKDLGTAIKHLRHTMTGIINELDRRDFVVVGEPDVIGPMVIPAIPQPAGIIDSGQILPPRKQWMDLFMQQLEQIVPLMHKEIASLPIPADKQEQVAPVLAQMKNIFDDIETHYQNLIPLMVGPVYDTKAVGKEALAIFDDTTKIQGPFKEIHEIIRSR